MCIYIYIYIYSSIMTDVNISGLQEPPTNEDYRLDINHPEPAGFRPSGRRIHRVLPYLRGNNERLYDPVVLSLGPYHYGKPEFRHMERIKENLLGRFVEESIAKSPSKNRGFFYKAILEKIDEVRDNYEREGVVNEDEVLAEIILRDACFLITYMEDIKLIVDTVRDHLGMATTVFIGHDVRMLENQIPLWVIARLIDLRDGEHKAGELVCKHLSFVCFGDDQHLTKLPWDVNDPQPLHLLEAGRAALLKRFDIAAPDDAKRSNCLAKIFKTKKDQEKGVGSAFKKVSLPFRSVTYLKAKGIRFTPSTSCLRDLKFHSGSCYGTLEVPTGIITGSTKGFLSNLIALEMSPGNPPDFTVTSYVNFMKSLVETSKDVKELREKLILFSTMVHDEDVVKVLEGIPTYGLDDYDSFVDVNRDIDEHCKSTGKTWMAEFSHNYLRSPWTITALIAATFVLCLTVVQTFFTIHPPKK
ncbi:UPF0481 protein At3g47200-like [Andrographis paniculata]|uniref:UPF0481 protein At3g47200-like n=1 Tax=Andrographis paniculata TaxID=175694 RepID=UPI0021E92343|nr:UPF0481 protein At3g47200-like [Andrographis paniculata]